MKGFESASVVKCYSMKQYSSEFKEQILKEIIGLHILTRGVEHCAHEKARLKLGWVPSDIWLKVDKASLGTKNKILILSGIKWSGFLNQRKTMLSNNDVQRILTLQIKAYNLFIWIVESLKLGTLKFKDKHVGIDAQDIMRQWITRNKNAFPESVKIGEVSDSDMLAFVNLALSFPVVSFETMAGGKQIDGCSCGFCAIYSNNHYVPRKLKSKDNERADAALQLVIQTLAEELALKLTRDQVILFQERNPEVNRSAMVIAYLYDLDRRTRYEVQNSTGLTLWRRLKSKSKSKLTPRQRMLQDRRNNKSKFQITVADYSSAIEDLRNKLTKFFNKKETVS